MLSSGFGWVYLLYLVDIKQMASERDYLDAFNDARLKSFDIFQPSNFVAMDHPGIASPLIVVSLPAGFILLGLIAERGVQKESKAIMVRYLVIVAILSLAGALFHPEFNLFIVIGSISALVFKLPRRNIIFAGFMISQSLLMVIDGLPGQYISAVKIAGIPLVYLSLVFTMSIFLLSILTARTRSTSIATRKKITDPNSGIRLTLLFSIALFSLLAYFYVFTFLVWGELSIKDVQIQTSKSGQQIIPWYLYPMKLGICGLLGLSFLLSYLFRRFEKEILVFGIIIIVALFFGTYYDEHRFSKYIMAGLVGLAAIAVYDLIEFIISGRKNGAKSGAKLSMILVSTIIVFTIVLASMSAILYVGYSALAIENHYGPFDRDLPKRHFPSPSELSLLKFIFDDYIQDSSNNYNVVTSSDEYEVRHNGFTGKLEAFVGIPERKLLKGHDILKNSTLEQFYRSLNNTNTKFIVLSKEDIIHEYNYTNTIHSASRPSEEDLIQPARFASANFKRLYENNDYIVLSVPASPLIGKDSSAAPKSDNDEKPESRPELKLNDIVKLPGDVSQRAKQIGVEVPWQRVMDSEIGISMAILILAAALVIGKRSLSRKNRLKNYKL